MGEATGITFVIYLNSDLQKRIRLRASKKTSLSLLLSKCKEKFRLDSSIKCLLYDFRGDVIAEDDLDYINSDEPLFLSLGEEFSQNVLLALYEKIKTIGKGGFGTVKLYKHRQSKTEVAIKFISTRRLVKPEFVSRAYKEIQLLRDLSHPNIIKLIDVFPISNQICFIMEYCEGGELKNYIQKLGFLPDFEVIFLALQLCDAIRYCHNSNVIHRDLKPENIMFKDKEKKHIVIVDFGIAGIFNLGTLGEKSSAGSLLYLAPEVVSGGDNSACPALDIWSLGCIVYYMLTGKRPFNANNRADVIKKIVKGEIAELPTNLNRWKGLIHGTLAVDPEKRWNILKTTESLYKIRNGDLSEDIVLEPPKQLDLPRRSAMQRNLKTPPPSLKLPILKKKTIKHNQKSPY